MCPSGRAALTKAMEGRAAKEARAKGAQGLADALEIIVVRFTRTTSGSDGARTRDFQLDKLAL